MPEPHTILKQLAPTKAERDKLAALFSKSPTTLSLWAGGRKIPNEAVLAMQLLLKQRDLEAKLAAATAALETINRWCGKGDVNIQPLLLPIQEQARAALAVLAQEDQGNDDQ